MSLREFRTVNKFPFANPAVESEKEGDSTRNKTSQTEVDLPNVVSPQSSFYYEQGGKQLNHGETDSDSDTSSETGFDSFLNKVANNMVIPDNIMMDITAENGTFYN